MPKAALPRLIDLEQPAEVVPDRARVVRVAVLIRLADRFGGEQAAIFAEGAEQHPVEQLLGTAEHVMPGHVGIVAAKPLEGVLPHVGIAEVELLGQFLSDPLRFGQQVVEMAAARFGDHPRRAQQEDEPLQQGVARRQAVRCRTARRSAGRVPLQ